MIRVHPLLLAVAVVATEVPPVSAQGLPRTPSPPRPAPATPRPISDNSFLVEEAYNQERGIVQHITTLRLARGGGWAASFTQEWPAPGQRHQLSYTVPLSGDTGSGPGLGDVSVNYRYQTIGQDDEPVWFSPRLSVIIPTGDANRGAGGPGLQVNLPLSIDMSPALVTHWNAGATLTRGRSSSGTRRTTRGVNAAASAIWLLAPAFNVMLETAWERFESLDDAGRRSAEQALVVLPGFRAAINLAPGMQVVPGVGVPLGIGPSRGDRGVFLYLSVEHAFR